jgi:hypothetical protein
MSRCSRTDALLDASLRGDVLTGSEADHATNCAECARTLAEARRFERELQTVGTELSPEPTPGGMITATAATNRDGWSVNRRFAVGGGITAAVVVALVVGSFEPGGADEGSARQGATADARTDEWVQSARTFVTRADPDGGGAAGWEPVRIERCGRTGLAFFEATATDGLPLYRWAMGSVDMAVPQASGQVRSVDDANVARLRSTLPPCHMVTDAVTAPVFEIGGPRELWAVTTGEEDIEGEVHVIGATTASERHRRGPLGEEELPTYLVVLDRQTDDAHWVERASISVADGWAIGSDVAVERSGAPRAMQVFADPGYLDETLFAWIDDPDVRAVDIWVPREARVLRYTVAAPGFVIQFDARVGPVDEMSYELLDEHGAVLAAGAVAPWSDVMDRP